ncbi:MAG: SIS domain-containing protein [Armatimonadetes bacterium]|nr:SIS domain-containing protein [Armatimonadota bacterium]
MVDLRSVVEGRFAASMTAPERFFEVSADRLAEACLAMARQFHRGGRLFAFGNGSSATDAQHVAVEFVHPVITGKRALPALALSGEGADPNDAFIRQLETLAGPEDIAMGFSADGGCANVRETLEFARKSGMLTIVFAGREEGDCTFGAEFAFVVPCNDPLVLQEVHEMAYHVLWELVHVFFEHRGLLETNAPPQASASAETGRDGRGAGED